MKHIGIENTDNNQKAIVKALRKIPGVKVETGHDDIIVGCNGKNYWFEIKNPDEAVSKRTGNLLINTLQDSQKAMLATWTGHYSVVWTLEQILKEIGIDAT